MSLRRVVSRAAPRSAVGVRGYAPAASTDLTEEQHSIVDLAANFAKATFEPNAATWDREKHFPVAELRAAAELGFGAIYTTPDFGGTGLSRLDASLIFEQLSMSDPSTTAFISIHNMCAWMVDSFGSPALREELVPSLATMGRIASYCLTEPSSGSDAAALKTTAVDKGDYYEVTGSKAFISGAGVSDLYVVMVRTGGPGPKGISCLAIDKDLEGVSFGANERKLGWCSQPTRVVSFDKVKVPKTRLIGAEGQGFKIAMSGLDGGRVNIATCSLGGAQRCLDLAAAYVKDRHQFGAPLSELQATQFRLAEMAAKVYASRLVIRDAARSIDTGAEDKTARCAMAKMLGTEQCFTVVDEALQLHGGYGYLSDFPVERFLRDLRVHRILEGTNEVMRMITARQVLKE